MAKTIRVPGDVSFRFKSAAVGGPDSSKAIFTPEGASYNMTADTIIVGNVDGDKVTNLFVAPRESELIDSLKSAGFQHNRQLEIPEIQRSLK